jgi:hypothetical protein
MANMSMPIIEMKSIWSNDGVPIKAKIECGSYPIDLYFHYFARSSYSAFSFMSAISSHRSRTSCFVCCCFKANENISDTLLIPFRFGVWRAKYFRRWKPAAFGPQSNCEKGESSKDTQSCRERQV